MTEMQDEESLNQMVLFLSATAILNWLLTLKRKSSTELSAWGSGR
jgi:hypothetical protein